MDIKDFILIGGGLLIAMVVGHGFWIAWRAKREPLRMDIVPDLVPDDIDEIERLRGELPNGGARLVRRRVQEPAQETLALDEGDAPLLVQPAGTGDTAEKQTTEPLLTAPQGLVSAAAPAASATSATKSVASDADTKLRPRAPFDQPKKLRARVHQAPPRVPVAEEQMELAAVTPGVTSQVREVEFELEPIVAEKPAIRRPTRRELRTEIREEKRQEKRTAKHHQEKSAAREVSKEAAKETSRETSKETSKENNVVEELLIINVLAMRGQRFEGEALISALRSQGLRYGDMNIFHRVDTATKAKLYSVANAVEPGTFDLADLNTMRSPGMTFFLHLPGPDDISGVFEDMLQAARNVALALGGELRDEDMSVLTGQTTEHMRQRIADFARRRLSKRA